MQECQLGDIPTLTSKLSQSHNFHSLEKPAASARSKLKLITSNSMNDTFANWRKKKKKTLKTQQHSETLGQITDQDLGITKPADKSTVSAGIRGMTLEEYFRVRSSSETRHHQPLANCKEEQECDETKNYLKQTFEIHQADEDNYQESQKSVRTPEFNQPQAPDWEATDVQRRIVQKYGRKHSKLKTESHEDEQQLPFEQVRNKTRFPTMSTEDRQQPSEQIDTEPRRQRVVSHPNANKLSTEKKHSQQGELQKYEGDFKKRQILEKVRQEKDRIHDIKINELGFVTKYATKFNINEAICKQIIKDCRL